VSQGQPAKGGRGADSINTFGGDSKRAGQCACALAGRSALLRGQLLEQDPCEVRVRVEEVLATPAGLMLRAAPGDEISARLAAGACSEGPALAPGDEVLLVYAQAESGDANEALLASWGEQLVFGSASGTLIALPRSEQRALLDAVTCTQSFAASGEPMASEPLPQTCSAR
jgi:hypothetical protein